MNLLSHASQEVSIELEAQSLAQASGLRAAPNLASIAIISPARFARTGMAMRSVFKEGRAAGKAESQLAADRARSASTVWWGQITSGEHDRDSLAREHGVVPSCVSRVLRIAFLLLRLSSAFLAATIPPSSMAAGCSRQAIRRAGQSKRLLLAGAS